MRRTMIRPPAPRMSPDGRDRFPPCAFHDYYGGLVGSAPHLATMIMAPRGNWRVGQSVACGAPFGCHAAPDMAVQFLR